MMHVDRNHVLTIEWNDGHVQIIEYESAAKRDEGYKAYGDTLQVKKVMKSQL